MGREDSSYTFTMLWFIHQALEIKTQPIGHRPRLFVFACSRDFLEDVLKWAVCSFEKKCQGPW